jgi:hypothetical protein
MDFCVSCTTQVNYFRFFYGSFHIFNFQIFLYLFIVWIMRLLSFMYSHQMLLSLRCYFYVLASDVTVTQMLLLFTRIRCHCHSVVTSIYSHQMLPSLRCYFYVLASDVTVTQVLLLCTRIRCYCHPRVTFMYSHQMLLSLTCYFYVLASDVNVTQMLLLCTRIRCYCHSDVTFMYSHQMLVTQTLLLCTRIRCYCHPHPMLLSLASDVTVTQTHAILLRFGFNFFNLCAHCLAFYTLSCLLAFGS